MMVKNSLTVGKHMPSKGMYNVHRHQKPAKPQTAGAAGKRQRHMQAEMAQDHYKHPQSGNMNQHFSKCQSQVLPSSMFNSTGKRMLSALHLSRKVSTYQQNMQHIRYISNVRSAKHRVQSSNMEPTGQQSNEDNFQGMNDIMHHAYEAPNMLFNPLNDVEIVEITSSQYMNDVRKSLQQLGQSQDLSNSQHHYGKQLLARSKPMKTDLSGSAVGIGNETINSNIQVKAVTAVKSNLLHE